MKKSTKLILFFAAAAVNIIFFLLCGYGQVMNPNEASYLDPFLGIVAVAVLAIGEMSVAVQLYFIGKYSSKKRRMFDKKLWLQCAALVAYYVACAAYLSAMIYRSGVGYISVFAIALCPLWLAGGSRILWTGHTGEEAYYLNDMGKWHEVRNVMENDDVVEITCQALGDRERTISIAKKKQELDQ